MISEPGIYSISAEEYHRDCCEKPSLSATIAKMLCDDSPLHARTAHVRLNPAAPTEEEVDHLNIGTAAHALLLEGLAVAEVLDFPDWRTKAAREARDAAREAGKVPLLTKHWGAVLAMATSARAQLSRHRASDMFTDGKPEQVIVWKEGDVWCRARLDWLHDSLLNIDDYKTTGATANPEVISRTLFQNGWDIQAAFYLRGLQAIRAHTMDVAEFRNSRLPDFRFAVQETYPPYALSVVALGPDALMLAEKRVTYALDKWHECLRTDTWPGYITDVAYASLPAHLEARWLEKELEEV